jgi:chemotaxis protein histidine kinase CheA
VLVGTKQGTLCVLVDAIRGHRQVVVHALADVVSAHDCLTGVAQLSGGRLALVVGVPELMRTVARAADAIRRSAE